MVSSILARTALPVRRTSRARRQECVGGVCQPLCGNGVVDPGEDCSTCPADVPCPPATTCAAGVCEADCPEDVNGDGSINVLDLIDLLLLFGTTCP